MMNNKIFLALILLLTSARLFAAGPVVRISGSADFLANGDSVSLSVTQYTGRLEEIGQQYNVAAKGNRFVFEVTGCDQPQYLQLSFHNAKRPNTHPLILFPGDDLNVRLENNILHFNGSSAAKFETQEGLREIAAAFARRPYLHLTPETLSLIYDRIDSCATASLAYLEKRKAGIGTLAYRFLANDIQGEACFLKLERMTYACLDKSREIQEGFRDAFQKYGRPFNAFPSFAVADSSGEPTSGFSGDIVYQQYLVDSCAFMHRKPHVHDLYLYESTHFKGELRAQLVTSLFIIKGNSPEIRAADISHALTYIRNNDFRAVLEKIRAANNIGTPAPPFTLRDAQNNQVSLSDFKGKVVLLDFWFTGCGACEGMAPVLKKLEEKYVNKPVVFITISIDRKREQWLATLKTNLYTSPLSINLYTEGKGLLHSAVLDYNVRGCPTLTLIDKRGNIGPNPGWDENDMSKLIDRFLSKD